MIITVQSGQTLMDIAVQYYGSANGLIELTQDNGLTLSDEVFPGQSLTIRETIPTNSVGLFADYLAETKTVIVSNQAETNFEVLATNDEEGISDNDNNAIHV
ncbi:LysM peptidoglycan-binding domain-containing protein [Pedobacter sp. MW01-1-1]|uniref:LysM peptidoglycan-binding domain-containing protein n=1 Tax=Pedobacter sp. MW01-1-1 TaxID=3383027 RepID=UPI003FF09A32